MPLPSEHQRRDPAPEPDRVFATTHWTVVLSAQQETSPAMQGALNQLCRTYWYPLYAYVRRRGHSREDTQDLI